MRLVSFRHQGRRSVGLMVGQDGIVDLGRRPGGPAGMRELLADPEMKAARAAVGAPADLTLAQVEFLPVVPDPEAIFCLALNYAAHVAEVRDAGLRRDPPKEPAVFLRLPASQAAHDEAILLPRISESLDFEAELAVVIGRGGKYISEADAMDHVAGYACYNDGSVRDWQFHTRQITPGKNFRKTGGFGPWLVTKDEIPDPYALPMTLRLNGKVEQQATTGDMLFRIPKFINYVSSMIDLNPGDVLATGTPSGVGWSRNPPLFMKDGDVVEVEIGGIGVLRNPVRREAA